MGDRRVPHIRKSSFDLDEALYDGIKPWMSNSVRNWLHSILAPTSNGRTYYKDSWIHDIELHARINLGIQQDGFRLYSALIALFNADENYALDIVQATVELCKIVSKPDYSEKIIVQTKINELNTILVKSGSKWHIVAEGDKARMEARVNETTTAAFDKLSQMPSDAADHLKTSWVYCFGRSPSPSEAYTYAVKAVEAASWKLVTPKNMTATLGTIIKDFLTQAEAGRFSTIFNDKKENTSIDAIAKLMARLWEGHSDRHATGTYVEPTQAEAEAAVHMAIVLCHFFLTDAVTRNN